MNISKNSWHYRLINKFSDYYPPNSLCPYMRKLLGIMLMITLGTIVGCFLATTLVCAPLWWFGIINPVRPEFLHFASVLGSALWTLAVLIAAGVGLHELKGRHAMKHWNDAPKQPGLVSSWIKAKKQKICPFITFTEN